MTPGEYDSQLGRPVLARVSEPASRGAADPELPATAREFLKKYCHRCHGVRFEVPGYNVLDRDSTDREARRRGTPLRRAGKARGIGALAAAGRGKGHAPLRTQAQRR